MQLQNEIEKTKRELKEAKIKENQTTQELAEKCTAMDDSSREYDIAEQKRLKQIELSYNETLKNLFPASLGLSTVSKPQDIRKYLEKMKAITLSIFQLIPHVRQPSKKPNIYGLVLALRRILSSSGLSQDLSVDLSTDISMSDMKFAETQGLLYWYEAKFKEMHDKMMQSMQFDDIAEVLGNILGVEPTEINEETIVEMFNAVKERLDEADSEKKNSYVIRAMLTFY